MALTKADDLKSRALKACELHGGFPEFTRGDHDNAFTDVVIDIQDKHGAFNPYRTTTTINSSLDCSRNRQLRRKGQSELGCKPYE